MTKQIGLWIDHKQAVILTITDKDESLLKVLSGIERHLRFRGATHPRTPYSAQYQKGDDQLDKQYDGYLNKFYEKVLTHLRGANAVWIFGPGEAKTELKKRLEHQKVHAQIDGLEAAGKMTERQIAAKIRHHFQQVGVRI